MAQAMNLLLKSAVFSTVKYTMKPSHLNTIQAQVRCLYSPVTLGITGFLEQRTRTKSQLANIAEKFKLKMNEYTTDDAKNMIFTEDLKNMIHIADDDDVDLIIKMMNKFNEQNKELRFGSYIFGPVVMRLFHHLNRPDEALQCFNSPKLEGFFDQLMSYQLLLDLLYENKKYDQVLEAFEKIKDRQIEGTKFPKNIIVLVMAACYRINTPESFKYAIELWKSLLDVGHLPMRRAITFYAALALHQKQPEAALEIIASSKNQTYTTIRNIRLAAMLQVNRLEHVMPALKSILETEGDFKQTFNKDVLEQAQIVIDKSDDIELQHEFKKIMEYFKENGHIADLTLNEQICMEIAPPPFLGKRVNQQQYNRHRRFNDNRQQNNKYVFGSERRPGLKDMH